MKEAIVVRQTPECTDVKCPTCKRTIPVHNAVVDKPNDGFGMMHIGEQNLSWVVCMNKIGKQYCNFAGDMKIAANFQYKLPG